MLLLKNNLSFNCNYLTKSCVRLQLYIYIILVIEHNGDVSPENDIFCVK